MRIAAFIAGAILFSTPLCSFAEQKDPCASVGRLAAMVMTNRQNGVSLQASLDDIKAGTNAQTYSLMEEMVMNAYSVPLFIGEEIKMRAIGDFRDREQLACMKLMRRDTQ